MWAVASVGSHSADSVGKITAKTGRGYEQHYAHEQRYHRYAVALSVALEVLGRHGAFETEELLREFQRPYLPAAYLSVAALAYGVYCRDPYGASGRYPGGNEYHQKADDSRSDQRHRVKYQRHLNAAYTGETVEVIP